MSKTIIFFKKEPGKKKFPIIRSFNVPAEITLPKNANTIKTSNISLDVSCKQEGYYRLTGEFKEFEGVNYLNVLMIMEIKDLEGAIASVIGSL